MKNLYYAYLKHLGDQTKSGRESVFADWAKLIVKPVDTVVDLGCYDGVVTKHVLKNVDCRRVIGVDIDQKNLKKASQNGIKIIKTDLNQKLPLKTGLADVVFSFQVIEHLVDLDVFLEEVYRILKPGGTFFISTENLASWQNVLLLIAGLQPTTGPHLSQKHIIGPHDLLALECQQTGKISLPSPHLNVMTAKSLKQMLVKNNFEIEKFRGVGYYPWPTVFWEPLTAIDKYHASFCLFQTIKKKTN
jgi:SAM-dependent methyltransferase